MKRLDIMCVIVLRYLGNSYIGSFNIYAYTVLIAGILLTKSFKKVYLESHQSRIFRILFYFRGKIESTYNFRCRYNHYQDSRYNLVVLNFLANKKIK